MYIHRDLEAKIKPFLNRKEAIAIVGPRQAGKTTLIKRLEEEFLRSGKKVKFITFERRADLELFQNSIEDFKDSINDFQCVIIDEFQYAKDGGQKLKYLYDTTAVKFIISGSSSLELMFQTGKYMVGRMLDFTLLPFSFREFLSFADNELYSMLGKRVGQNPLYDFAARDGFGQEINRRLSALLEKFVVYGGYPAVVLSKSDEEKQKILENIVEKYLLQDISGLLKMHTAEELVRLCKFLSAQTGGMVKFSDLANAANLRYGELIKHFNVLEKTFIIKLVRPFFTNRKTELVKNPKVYFIDAGIRNFLLSDFRSLLSRNDAGSLMENQAFTLLFNLYISNDYPKYWRTKSKAEVDFVIQDKDGISPIEIKYSSQKTIGKSYYSFLNKFKPKTGVILTKDYLGEEKIGATNVRFIPLCYL